MKAPQCKDCAFFRQHYTLSERKLITVNCGHCTFHRPKRKKPSVGACPNYIPGTKDADAFVSQEYLSKSLLQHILNMELLPPIVTDKNP